MPVDETNLDYIPIIEEIQRELVQIVDHFHLKSQGLVGKERLLLIRLEQNEAIMETAKRHNRVIRFHLGHQVEPVAHPLEAVLIGVGAQGE